MSSRKIVKQHLSLSYHQNAKKANKNDARSSWIRRVTQAKKTTSTRENWRKRRHQTPNWWHCITHRKRTIIAALLNHLLEHPLAISHVTITKAMWLHRALQCACYFLRLFGMVAVFLACFFNILFFLHSLDVFAVCSLSFGRRSRLLCCLLYKWYCRFLCSSRVYSPLDWFELMVLFSIFFHDLERLLASARVYSSSMPLCIAFKLQSNPIRK